MVRSPDFSMKFVGIEWRSALAMLIVVLLRFNGIEGATKEITELVIKDAFDRTFQQSCSKFSFVQDYWNNLEHPSNNFVEFVYNEADAPIGAFGGLGDRFAGLATAAAIALRFNRTLVVSDGKRHFSRYFRPYSNPKKMTRVLPMYDNVHQWAKFYSFYPSLFYLNHCINPEFKPIFTSNFSDINECGLDDRTTVQQKVIRIKSNRCYLCKWMKINGSPANKQVKSMLGLKENDNLFEAVGCLLRLAAWPTDYVFGKVADVLMHRIPTTSTSLLRKNESQTRQEREFATTMENNVNSISRSRHHTRDDNGDGYALPFTVGLHFRCGDDYLTKSADQCEHLINSHSLGASKREETPHMEEGTPDGMGSCANRLVRSYVSTMGESSQNTRVNSSPDVMIHVASDNARSTKQLTQYAAEGGFQDAIYIPPHTACHIDYDTTGNCYESTVVSWLLLSMSDVFVIPMQTLTVPSKLQVTATAFSRFAMIYGLQGFSMYDPFNCSLQDATRMSWYDQGNWMCTNELFQSEQRIFVAKQTHFNSKDWPAHPVIVNDFDNIRLSEDFITLDRFQVFMAAIFCTLLVYWVVNKRRFSISNWIPSFLRVRSD